MSPEELARKWGEVADHLLAGSHNGFVLWDHNQTHNTLDRTDNSVSLTRVTESGEGLSNYCWEGLTTILWIDGHKVAFVFELDGHKTTVTVSKDKPTLIVEEDSGAPSQEATVS